MALTKNCIVCSKTFRRRGKAAIIAKTCSSECFHKSRRKRTRHSCFLCKKKFYRIPSELEKNKTGKLFCSQKCSHKVMVPSTAYKKGNVPWSKGRKRSEITGKNNKLWKGDKVGYFGLHVYIKKHFGQPSTCDHCDTTSGKFEWANKTGKYKRVRNDWLRLCTKCHGKHDSLKNGAGIRGSSVAKFGKFN